MILLETAPTTTIDASAPASFTCAQCPFARLIEDNRYCCAVSQTASDVKRGHWEATVSCYEALAKAEAEKVAEVEEAPIAQTATPAAPAPAVTRAPSKPAAASHATTTAAASHATTTAAVTRAPIAPSAIGTNGDEPPNRGDNGRERVQPIAAKKLLPLIVPISRIRSDIPASNFDPNELEILGELMLSIGGFVVPPVLVRDSGGYRVVSGHLQFHAAVLAKQLNPRAGETIPAIVLESENQTTASAMLKMLKFAT